MKKNQAIVQAEQWECFHDLRPTNRAWRGEGQSIWSSKTSEYRKWHRW